MRKAITTSMHPNRSQIEDDSRDNKEEDDDDNTWLETQTLKLNYYIKGSWGFRMA